MVRGLRRAVKEHLLIFLCFQSRHTVYNGMTIVADALYNIVASLQMEVTWGRGLGTGICIIEK